MEEVMEKQNVFDQAIINIFKQDRVMSQNQIKRISINEIAEDLFNLSFSIVNRLKNLWLALCYRDGFLQELYKTHNFKNNRQKFRDLSDKLLELRIDYSGKEILRS